MLSSIYAKENSGTQHNSAVSYSTKIQVAMRAGSAQY